MSALKVVYRDVDRSPYLYAMRHCARSYGLELEVTLGGFTPTEWEQGLAAGAVDVLAENYWGLQTLVAKGAPFVCVATAATAWGDQLLAREGIASVGDLRGKKLAVRGLGPQELLPGQWLADMGLASEVQQVTYSEKDTGRFGNWKPVAAGECDACFISRLYLEAPLAAGLHVVPYGTYDYIGNVTLTTTRALIQGRHKDIQNLVNAAFDASTMFKTNTPAALEIIRGAPRELVSRQLDVSTEERVRLLADGLADELADAPFPTAEGISTTRRMLLGRSPELATFNPLTMWDLSFGLHALERRS
jgi:ABC-type nitrate/sulfonate/bicarbonate transport system substrate-binding protein